MNKKNKFGIISGAGPMAGALLYQLIIEKLQAQGAWHDADFPEILLLNIPFSEMLLGELDNIKVRNELLSALSFVSQFTDHVYIACQTLHAFLTDEDITKYKVVSLLSLIQQELGDEEKSVLVVGSKTSRLFELHPQSLQTNCSYVEHALSEQAIEAILKGKTPDLTWLEHLAKENRVILGCTEFSVATQKSQATFIDPIKLAANDIVNKFNQTN